MQGILSNLRSTVIAGFILTVILFILIRIMTDAGFTLDQAWFAFFFRWLHVLSGVMWIGLLWYFNFVIAPAALWWFRWGAMATIATGLIVASMNGYVVEALALGLTDGGASTPIGIGMWLGIIMWANVWFVIWPNQKKALGMVKVSDAEKAAAGRTAMLFSRTNTLLSFPMLFCMVAAQNGGF
jgi:uncharacterized membrane protein